MRETTNNATEAQREARGERAGGGGAARGESGSNVEGCWWLDRGHDAPLCVVCAMPFAVVAGGGGGQCGYVIGFAFLVRR